MEKRTKIIVASIVGAIIIIPIVLFLMTAIIFSMVKKSGAVTSSYAPETSTMQNALMVSGSADFDTRAATPMAEKTMFDDQITTLTAGETAAEVDQKIIKTGYLDLTVDAVGETVTKLTAFASGKGGYVQSSSVYERENGTKYGTAVIRVPAAEFENTITEIKKWATAVNTESANGQDVTEEYTDLEAQLRNAQAQEAEYLEILKKAVSVDDILSVQSYLGQVREQVEMLQGRIKYLNNLTSYSTVTISLSEEPMIKVPTKEFRPWTAVKEATRTLIAVGQNMIISLIWLVILIGGVFLPIIVIFVIAILVIKKIWKKMANKNRAL